MLARGALDCVGFRGQLAGSSNYGLVNVNVAVKRYHPSAFQALPGIHRLRCSPRYHSELQSIISASEQEREPICDGKAC